MDNGIALAKVLKYTALFLLLALSTGTSWALLTKKEKLSDKETRVAEAMKLSDDEVKKLEVLKATPLYEFKEADVDLYLRFLYQLEPDPARRIVHLARKSIGQPYNIFLLGEFPFEMYDADPLYTLEKSDCLVFSEHMYAMGLGWDWNSFFPLLQRIRYKDGEISMTTRNHYTTIDWDQNNSWLIRDVTDEIAGDRVKSMTTKTGRKKFFEKYNIDYTGPEEELTVNYIPADVMPDVVKKLKNADFVNVIRGFDDPSWCGHTGLITVSDDGTVNFLHSTPPKVIEQPILEYTEKGLKANPGKKKNKKALFYGFRFFRLRDDAFDKLKEIDGPDAPRVTGPRGILKTIPQRISTGE